MNKFLIATLTLVSVFFVLASPASADMPNFSFNIWQGTGQGSQTCNATTGTSTIGCSTCDAVIVAGNIVNNVAVPLGIILAVVFIVYGALRMITSFGSGNNFEAGKKAITTALIGLVVILCAWLIVNTLFTILTGNPNFPWAQIKC